jgi:16S rRNA (uracil1498-N3)-methyltransferase
MPAERYFLSEDFNIGEHKILKGADLNHLFKVMRGKEKDVVELVNGRGVLAKASILSIDRKQGCLEILEIKKEKPEMHKNIIVQAIPLQNRLDIILEKGTELGMSEIWFFPGDYSVKKIISEQLFRRLESITIAAMKQCGRLFLPKIVLMPPLKKWAKPQCKSFFGDVNSEAPPFDPEPQQDRCFFVGPESGFSEKEIAIMLSWDSVGVKLHKNILRTDTASLVALSIVSKNDMV